MTKSNGFTLIEVLIAFSILVMAVSLAFTSYQSSLISLERFDDKVKTSYYLPFVKRDIEEKIRLGRKQGRFKWGEANVEWRIVSTQESNSSPGIDFDSGARNFGGFQLFLHKIDCEIEFKPKGKKARTHQYQFSRMTEQRRV